MVSGALFKPRFAIVTGASEGLGREIALLLAGIDCFTVIVSRKLDRLKAAMEVAAPSQRHNLMPIVADLTKRENFISLVQRCKECSQPENTVDLLINNAGASALGRSEEIPLSVYEKIWTLNYLAPISLVQQVLPEMKAQNRGFIVNITSGTAKRALPFESPYCSTKAALSSFSDSLRSEVRAYGVGVLDFSPGLLDTGFHRNRKHYGETRLEIPFPGGRPAGVVARKLIKSIFQRKERVLLGRSAIMASHLNYWSPKIVDRILEKKLQTIIGRSSQ